MGVKPWEYAVFCPPLLTKIVTPARRRLSLTLLYSSLRAEHARVRRHQLVSSRPSLLLLVNRRRCPSFLHRLPSCLAPGARHCSRLAIVFARGAAIVPVTDMSQQHLPFPPPPPPPQGSVSPRAGTAPYFTQQHQRTRPGPAQPPSITTNFLRTQGVGPQSQTPASAVGSAPHSALSYTHTPSTPSARTPSAAYPDAGHLLDPSRAYHQSPASPSMAQQPYNPRQWSGHGHGSHLAYSQHPSPLSRANVEVTGMEGE